MYYSKLPLTYLIKCTSLYPYFPYPAFNCNLQFKIYYWACLF